MPGSQGSTSPRPPRIAVVAVHGVADQKAGESARTIANLLASVDGAHERESRYRLLTEEALRIPVRPLWDRREAADDADPTSRSGRLLSLIAAPLSAWSGDHRRSDAVKRAQTSEQASDTPASLEFMDEQLHHYQSKGPSATYDTVRVSAEREGDAAHDEGAHVDIFEMYWADLSRAHSGIFRIAAEAYQLFLHLSNLGGQLLDYEVLKRGRQGGWGALARTQGYAISLLTLVIPIANLFMLGTGVVLLTMKIRPVTQVPFIAAITLGMLAALAADRIRWRISTSSGARFLLVPLITGFLVFRLAKWIGETTPIGNFGAYHLLAIATIGISAVLLNGIIHKMERSQPGALAVAAGAAVTWVAALLFFLGRPIQNSAAAVSQLALWLLETFFFANTIAWLTFLMLVLTSSIRGMVMSWTTARNDQPARNAIATARITLALPAIGVLTTTIFIWIGLYHMLEPYLPTNLIYHPALPLFAEEMRLDVFAHRMLGASLTSGVVPALMLLALGTVIALWSLIPVVFSEVQPPKPARTDAEEQRRSDRMGRRLTQAYRAARISGWLMLGALTAFLVGGIHDILRSAAEMNALGLDWLHESTAFRWVGSALQAIGFRSVAADAIVVKVGALFSISAVGLIALNGRLQFMALGLRPLLDIALDVDNYLRLHPLTDAPRARIAERFGSLLKHVLDRGPEDDKYDAVVFITHSQGTVITADLLRYLRNRDRFAGKLGFVLDRSSGKSNPPTALYLFTMGSPLRQLYYPRFPALYDWIGPPSATTRSAIPDDATPAPTELGVRRWVNVFRSGDYVGRSLWFDEARCRSIYCRVDADDTNRRRRRRTEKFYEGHPDIQVAEDASETRREACIGPGAHTHYWDDSAPDVAAFLDDLIAEAVQGGRVVAPGRMPPRNWSPIAPPKVPVPTRPA